MLCNVWFQKTGHQNFQLAAPASKHQLLIHFSMLMTSHCRKFDLYLRNSPPLLGIKRMYWYQFGWSWKWTIRGLPLSHLVGIHFKKLTICIRLLSMLWCRLAVLPIFGFIYLPVVWAARLTLFCGISMMAAYLAFRSSRASISMKGIKKTAIQMAKKAA